MPVSNFGAAGAAEIGLDVVFLAGHSVGKSRAGKARHLREVWRQIVDEAIVGQVCDGVADGA